MSHSSLQAARLDFWTGFAAWLRKNSDIRPPKPCQHGFQRFSIGRSGFYIGALITRASRLNRSNSGPGVQIELVMDSAEAKTHLKRISALRPELEKKLGFDLREHNNPTAVSAKLWVRWEIDIYDEKNWPACFEWLGRHLQRFKEVFGPIALSL